MIPHFSKWQFFLREKIIFGSLDDDEMVERYWPYIGDLKHTRGTQGLPSPTWKDSPCKSLTGRIIIGLDILKLTSLDNSNFLSYSEKNFFAALV